VCPLLDQKSVRIYMTKEAVRLKNKKNRLWRHYTETKSHDTLSAFKHAKDSLQSLTTDS